MRTFRLPILLAGVIALASAPVTVRLLGQVATTPGVIVDNADTTGAFSPGTFVRWSQKIGYGGSTHGVGMPTYNVVKDSKGTTMTMTSVATFSFANVQAGTYSVYATWPFRGNPSAIIETRIPAPGGNYRTYGNIPLNQSQLPSSITAAGAKWQWTQRVVVDVPGTVTVRIFPDGKPKAVTYADAVMLVREDAASSSSQSSSVSSAVSASSQGSVISYLPSWNVLTPMATPVNCRALDTSVAQYQIPEGAWENASPRGETKTESYEYQCDSNEKTRVVWMTTAYPGRYVLYADWSAYPWSQWGTNPSLTVSTAVTYSVSQNGKTLATINLSQRAAGSVADLTWKRTCYGSSRCRAELPLQRLGEITPTETGPLVVTMNAKPGGVARGHYIVALPVPSSSQSSSTSSVSSSARSSIDGPRFTPTPGEYILSSPIGTYVPYCSMWDGILSCSGESVPARTVWWKERLEPGAYELYADWPGNVPAVAPVTYTAYDRGYRSIGSWVVDQNTRSKADLVTTANCSGYSWCGSDIPFQRIGSFSMSEAGLQNYMFNLTFPTGGMSRAHYLLIRKVRSSSSMSSESSVSSVSSSESSSSISSSSVSSSSSISSSSVSSSSSISTSSSSSSSSTSSSSSSPMSSSSNASIFELPPPPAACQDGIDNDGDGKKDFPQDPGCANVQDSDEKDIVVDPTRNVTLTSVVANGCSVSVSYAKNFETCVHMLVASSNSIMHTNNFFCRSSETITLSTKDFNDLFRVGTSVKLCNGNNYNDCSSPLTITGNAQCVLPQCSDGIDNDGDGVTDGLDFSCSGQADTDESSPRSMCQDGVDNDVDGKMDYPQDPGCTSLQDNEEYNVSDENTSPDDVMFDNSMMRPDYRCTSVADVTSVGGSYSTCTTGTVVSWNASITPGRYEVYATWKASPDVSQRVEVDFRSTGTFSSIDFMNFMRPTSLQSTPADVTINGASYRKMGSVDVLAPATMLTWGDPDRMLVGAAGKPIVIDAILLRRIGDTPYAREPGDVAVLDDEYSVQPRSYATLFTTGGYRNGHSVLRPELAKSIGATSFVQFTVPPIRAGLYDVLATWPAVDDATRTALLVIRSIDNAGGSVLFLDQTSATSGETIDGVPWKVVGKAYIPTDGMANVLVTPHSVRGAYVQGSVVVDGFMLRRSADQSQPTTFVMDNEDPRFETASTDYFVAPRTTDSSSYRGSHVVLRNDTPSIVPDPVARVNVSDGGRSIVPGTYDVYMTWRPQPESATPVRIQVFANNTPMSDPDMEAMVVNQSAAPEGIEWDGATWQKIGTRTVRPDAKVLYGNWYTGRAYSPSREAPRLISADAIMLRLSEDASVGSSSSSSASSAPSAPPIRLYFLSIGCSSGVRQATISYQRDADTTNCASLYDEQGVALDNGTVFCGRGAGMVRGMDSFVKPITVGASVKLCDTVEKSVCSPAVFVTNSPNACPAS